MVIVRRNPDGSIASTTDTTSGNIGTTQSTTSHPALVGKRGMAALSESGRSVPPMLHEIAMKVNNAKDKPRKLKVLQEHDSVSLRQILKGAFDPKIKWLLPVDVDIPYTKNDAPVGTEHTVLSQEAKRLYLFTEGGDSTLSNNKRETLFIQMLEGLCADEADFLIAVVQKKVNNKYKGFTGNLVKEAFNWNDDFMKSK